MNWLGGFLLAATVAAAPTPSPSPQAAHSDVCTAHGHTAVLNAVNRPTVGFSPCAIKRGEALLELGAQAGGGGSGQTHFGQGFLRFGLAPGIEIDAIGPDYILQRDPAARGFADSGLGMKWQVASDAQSAAGIDLLYTTPNGASALTAGHSTQTVNFDYARSFGNFGFATTLGALHANYDALLPSVVLSNQFNDRAQWYAEAFAQTHYAPGSGALMGLDGGLQILVTPDLEADAEIGRTISDTQRTRYVGAGLAIRL